MLVALGQNNAEVAAQLAISVGKGHVSIVLAKLGAQNSRRRSCRRIRAGCRRPAPGSRSPDQQVT